jgi:hypothetical protein
MKRELARHVIDTAFRAGRELEELLRLLKQHLSADEYQEYAMGVAAAIDAINVALLDKALRAYPDLEAEIEASLGD